MSLSNKKHSDYLLYQFFCQNSTLKAKSLLFHNFCGAGKPPRAESPLQLNVVNIYYIEAPSRGRAGNALLRESPPMLNTADSYFTKAPSRGRGKYGYTRSHRGGNFVMIINYDLVSVSVSVSFFFFFSFPFSGIFSLTGSGVKSG